MLFGSHCSVVIEAQKMPVLRYKLGKNKISLFSRRSEHILNFTMCKQKSEMYEQHLLHRNIVSNLTTENIKDFVKYTVTFVVNSECTKQQ